MIKFILCGMVINCAFGGWIACIHGQWLVAVCAWAAALALGKIERRYLLIGDKNARKTSER